MMEAFANQLIEKMPDCPVRASILEAQQIQINQV